MRSRVFCFVFFLLIFPFFSKEYSLVNEKCTVSKLVLFNFMYECHLFINKSDLLVVLGLKMCLQAHR